MSENGHVMFENLLLQDLIEAINIPVNVDAIKYVIHTKVNISLFLVF